MNAQRHYEAAETLLAEAENRLSDFVDKGGPQNDLLLINAFFAASANHARLCGLAAEHHRPSFPSGGNEWAHVGWAE